MHGDPIGGIDPTGLMSSTGTSVAAGGQATLASGSSAGSLGALAYAKNVTTFIRHMIVAANTAYDGINAFLTVIDFTQFDPDDLIELQEAIPEFQDFIQSIGPNAPNKLLDTKTLNFGIKARGKLGRILQLIQVIPRATERIGEFGASLVASLLGFKPLNLQYSNTGIDAVLYNETLDRYMILEAKGSNTRRRLAKLSRKTKQMSHAWIENRLDKLIDRSQSLEDGRALRDSFEIGGRVAVAMVVSLNLNASKIRVGAQLFDPGNDDSFKKWKGF